MVIPIFTNHSMKNGVPKNGHSVFPVIYLGFRKRMGSMGSMGSSMVDNKGMVGNNNRIQVLEPIAHQ
jgi:hypothetical protein